MKNINQKSKITTFLILGVSFFTLQRPLYAAEPMLGKTSTSSAAVKTDSSPQPQTTPLKGQASTHDGTLNHPYTVEDCTTAATCPDGVYRFTPQDDKAQVQTTINAIYTAMSGDSNAIATYSPEAEWSNKRYALLFAPGNYDVKVQVNYYTQVLGLGTSPSDVTLNNLYVDNLCLKNDPKSCLTLGALNNFWRGVENVTFNPTACRIAPDPQSEFKNNKCIVWNVSQASPLRNVVVNGDLLLNSAGCFNNAGQCNGPAGSGGDTPCAGTYNTDFVCGAGYASGGFMANVKVNGAIHSIAQQQWFTRNSGFNLWAGGVWNMVFLNSTGDLPTQTTNTNVNMDDAKDWQVFSITSIQNKDLVIQEKPYLVTKEGQLQVFIPGKNVYYPLGELALLGKNNQDISKINSELASKPGLVIEPGVYSLNAPIHVPSGKFVLGLGLAELNCLEGTTCLEVSGKGAIIAGVMLGAGYQASPSLLHVSKTENATSPGEATTLLDIFCRIGEHNPTRQGSGPTTDTCVTIDADYALGDNLWLWRADHDRASSKGNTPLENLVKWNENLSKHGLVVNGNYVTMLGLFSEHHQQSNTLWKGNHGTTYFYQSELPYDAPTDWKCADFTNSDSISGGCPGYFIDKSVTSHTAAGLGVYTFFQNDVIVPAAVVSPKQKDITIEHLVGRYLNGAPAPRTASGFTCLIRDYDPAVPNCFGSSAGPGKGVDDPATLPALGAWPASTQ